MKAITQPATKKQLHADGAKQMPQLREAVTTFVCRTPVCLPDSGLSAGLRLLFYHHLLGFHRAVCIDSAKDIDSV